MLAPLRRVYRPFIVKGPAAWTESWHAPRYAGGFHLHEGQDVLCRDGTPVLAATAGRVEFDVDTLGGRIARLFLPDGDYWYYAHLSDWNSTVDSGSRVELGDVIGYCGNSGDAVGGPTHVHFGHYLPSGQAVDTMSDLIGWLEAAERRAGVSERRAEAARTTTTVVPTYPTSSVPNRRSPSRARSGRLGFPRPVDPPLRRPPTCWRSRWPSPPACC